MHLIDVGAALISAVVQYPPHVFLGYTIAEWVGIVTIIGMLGTFLTFVFNQFLVKPITGSMDRLSSEIKDFKQSSHEEHLDFRKDLDDHEDRIEVLERNDAVQDHVLDELVPHKGGKKS